MNYAYVRVSTDSQDCMNQKLEIKKYAKTNKLTKLNFIEETKSGTVEVKKRLLGDLLDKLEEGDVLIVTEISRLGRSMSMIVNVMELLMKKKVTVIAIKNNLVMKDNDLATKMLVYVFGISAEVEKTLISERTKQGLAKIRSQGKNPAEMRGEVYYVKLRKYQKSICRKYDRQHKSIYSLAKEYSVTWTTMKRFLTKFRYQTPPPPLVERPRRHGHPSYREIQWFRAHGEAV